MENKEYKDNVSKVIEKAREKGAIKKYSEFIKEKDAQEYNLLKEEVEYYEAQEANKHNKEKYKEGDIVYVSHYKYKNGETGYNHIFVIIDKEQVVDINYFGFLLSSKLEKAKYQYNKRLNKNQENKLNKNSIVKCDDLIEIKASDIKFKIGEVTKEGLNRFIKLFLEYLEEE